MKKNWNFLLLSLCLTCSLNKSYAKEDQTIHFHRQVLMTKAMSNFKIVFKDANDAVSMTPARFEDWVNAELDATTTQPPPPLIVERAILLRLHKGGYVTDDTLITAAVGWVNYESSGGDHSKKGIDIKQSYPNSKRAIRAYLAALYKRPYLEARLYEVVGVIFTNESNAPEAAKAYEMAVSLLTPLHLDIDRERMHSLVDEADALYDLSNKDNSKAEALYLEALSCDFDKVYISLKSLNDTDAYNDLRDTYIRAAGGLIDCRRNNLRALESTFLLPSVRQEVQPILDMAIRDAKNSTKLPASK